MPEIWVDIEDGAGNRLGAGPITSVIEWRHEARLDEAGSFSLRMPASDPRSRLLERKRVAHAWAVEGGVRHELGLGIIDCVQLRLDPRGVILEASGPDILAELGARTVGHLTICEQQWMSLSDPTRGALGWYRNWVVYDEGGSGYIRSDPNVAIPNAHDGNALTYESIYISGRTDAFSEASDWLYVGYDARFSRIYFDFIDGYWAPESNRVLNVQYYNGEGWINLSVTDYTDNGEGTWKQDGYIEFVPPGDWVRYTAQYGMGNWFWVRIRVRSGQTGYVRLAEVRVWADVPTKNGVNLIMAHAPAGWATSGYPQTVTERYLELDGESVLAALRALCDQGGQLDGQLVREHFRLGTGRTLEWLGATQPHSGVRAVQEGPDPHDPTVALIAGLSVRYEAGEVVTRIIPYSQDGITLALTTRTAPQGYTLSKAGNYIESSAGVATYGRIEQQRRFSDISRQQTDSYTAHPEMCANALFDAGLEYLRTHDREQTFYDLDLLGTRATLKVGTLIDVVYRERVVEGVPTVSVDDTLYILGVATSTDRAGALVTRLSVASIDRPPVDDTRVLTGAIRDSRRAGAATSDTVIRATVTEYVPPSELVTRYDDQVLYGTFSWQTGNQQQDLVRIGNLAKSYGYGTAPVYGLAVGLYASAKPTLTLDPVHGLRLRQGTTTLIQLRADGTAMLAGWELDEEQLSGGDAMLHSDGWLRLGTGDDVVCLDAGGATWRLWAGDATPGDAPFRVDKEGKLWADDATISGHIQALTGELRELDILDRLTLAGNGEIVSANYVSGVSGLRLGANGDIEAHNIWARGRIQTAVFEKGQISAVAGGVLVTPMAGVLVAEYEAGGTLIVEGTDWLFENGDVVRIRAANTVGDIAETWLTVTRTATINEYTTVVEQGDNASTWPAGTAVLGYGTGGGTLLLTAALEGSGPFYSVRTHGSQPWTGETEVVRLGNLRGSFGITTDVYGFGVGDFTAKKYLLWDGSDLHVRGRVYSDGMPIYGWNLCTNFSFEFGLSGWEQDTGYNSSDPPVVVTSPVFHGSYALRTRAWGNDYKLQMKTARIPVSPGTRVLFGCQIRNGTDTGKTGGCQVHFVNAQGNTVGWDTALRSDVDTTWKACRWEATAPSGAAFMEFRLVNGNNTTDYQYFDSCYWHYRDMEISVAPDVKLDRGGLHVLGASIYTGWGGDSKFLYTSYDQGHQHTVTLMGHRIKINDVWHIAIAM